MLLENGQTRLQGLRTPARLLFPSLRHVVLDLARKRPSEPSPPLVAIS